MASSGNLICGRPCEERRSLPKIVDGKEAKVVWAHAMGVPRVTNPRNADGVSVTDRYEFPDEPGRPFRRLCQVGIDFREPWPLPDIRAGIVGVTGGWQCDYLIASHITSRATKICAACHEHLATGEGECCRHPRLVELAKADDTVLTRVVRAIERRTKRAR